MFKKPKKDRDGLHRRPNIPDGIYYFYCRGADGRWRERSTGTRNYAEARDIRAVELGKIRSGEMPSELRDWILASVAKVWLEQQESLVLPITFAGYRWILRPILNRLGGKKVKDISPGNGKGHRVNQRCRARTKAGEPCKAVAVDKGLCTFHADPQKAAELGRSGGRKNRRYSSEPDTERLTIPQTVEDVKNLLAETMAGIHARRLDPKIGSVLGYLGTALLKAMEATDLEKRIATLERHGPEKSG